MYGGKMKMKMKNEKVYRFGALCTAFTDFTVPVQLKIMPLHARSIYRKR
jgi:hypothetical protein